jgi:hypothetical protein
MSQDEEIAPLRLPLGTRDVVDEMRWDDEQVEAERSEDGPSEGHIRDRPGTAGP